MKRNVRDIVMIVVGIITGALLIFIAELHVNDPIRLLKNSTKLELPPSIRVISKYEDFIYFNGDGEVLYVFDLDEHFLSGLVSNCPTGLATSSLMAAPFRTLISRHDNRLEIPACVENVSNDGKGNRVIIYFTSGSAYLYLDRS